MLLVAQRNMILIIAVAAFIAGSAVVHQRPQNYARILGIYSLLRQKMVNAGILSGFRDNSQKKILTNRERTVVPPTTGSTTDGEELPKPTAVQHSAEAIYQAEQIAIKELLNGDTQRKEQQEHDGEEDEEEEYDGEEEEEEEYEGEEEEEEEYDGEEEEEEVEEEEEIEE